MVTKGGAVTPRERCGISGALGIGGQAKELIPAREEDWMEYFERHSVKKKKQKAKWTGTNIVFEITKK